MSCLILFKSITYAQNAAVYLRNAGINAYIIRTPSELSKGGCGYSLKVQCNALENALKIFSASGIKYISSAKPLKGGGYGKI